VRRRGTGTVEPVPPAHGSARRFALNFDARRKVRHDGYLSEIDNVRRRGEQGNYLNSFRQSTDNFIENDYPENNFGLLNVKC